MLRYLFSLCTILLRLRLFVSWSRFGEVITRNGYRYQHQLMMQQSAAPRSNLKISKASSKSKPYHGSEAGRGQLLKSLTFQKQFDQTGHEELCRILLEESGFKVRPFILYTLQRCAKARHVAIFDTISLPKIIEWLASTDPGSPFSAKDVSQALYSLRLIPSNHPNLKDFISFIIEKIRGCREVFRREHIASSLYGLCYQDHTPDIEILLSELHKVIIKSQNNLQLGSREAASCLMGLRNMPYSTSPATRDLFSAIRNTLERPGTTTTWSALSITNCINGLQSVEVDEITTATLATINGHLKLCRDEFTARDLGCAYFGLKAFDNNCEVAMETVQLLNNKLEVCTETWSADKLASAISGLRQMSDGHPHIQQTMSLFAKQLAQYISSQMRVWRPQDFTNILIGLTNMQHSETTRDILRVIGADAAVRGFTTPFTSRELSLAFSALQNRRLELCPECETILELLATQLALGKGKLNMSPRDIAHALFGVKNFLTTSLPVVPRLMRLLTEQILLSPDDRAWAAAGLSMSFAGLGQFALLETDESDDVLLMIQAFVPKLRKLPPGEMDAGNLAVILHSLRDKPSSKLVIRQVLSAIYTQLKSYKGRIMSPQELCMALYGLKSCDSRHVETRQVISWLKNHLQEAMKQDTGYCFIAQGMGNALSGLQTMSEKDDSENSTDIKELVGLMADMLERLPMNIRLKEMMQPADIANALFGLQGMTAESEEVRAVLIAILAKIRQLDAATGGAAKYSIRDISYCFTGVSNMDRLQCVEVDEIIQELFVQVAKTELGKEPIVRIKQFGKGFRIEKVTKSEIQQQQQQAANAAAVQK